jgi:hypothetical protein
MNKIIWMGLVIMIVIIIMGNGNRIMLEGYTTYKLDGGKYPNSADMLLEDTYKLNTKNVNNINVSDEWWRYPRFKVGSFTQITNNLKYPNNPDISSCTPIDVCGIYNNYQAKSNISVPLPEADSQGRRINYYASN